MKERKKINHTKKNYMKENSKFTKNDKLNGWDNGQISPITWCRM